MGKFTSKLKNVLNGGMEDEYDDDFDDVYEDDDYIDEDNPDVPAPGERRRLFGGGKKSSADDKDDREPAKSGPFGSRASKAPARSAARGQEVCIFKPSSIEDSREITETLLEGKAVVVNFEGLHVEISQRIIDFISGSCYALDGNLQKISNYIFIATPHSVDISGDFQNLFSNEDGNFDISGFKSPLV